MITRISMMIRLTWTDEHYLIIDDNCVRNKVCRRSILLLGPVFINILWALLPKHCLGALLPCQRSRSWVTRGISNIIYDLRPRGRICAYENLCPTAYSLLYGRNEMSWHIEIYHARVKNTNICAFQLPR